MDPKNTAMTAPGNTQAKSTNSKTDVRSVIALMVLIIISLNVVLLTSISYFALKLSLDRSILMGGIPIYLFLFLVISIEIKKEDYLTILARLKYNIYFPFYLYDSKLLKNKSNSLPLLQNCDIVLRRTKNYLDGLIFSEKSYFTHAGIYYRDDNQDKVLHITIDLGVH